jgi:hypothetical protein
MHVEMKKNANYESIITHLQQIACGGGRRAYSTLELMITGMSILWCRLFDPDWHPILATVGTLKINHNPLAL